MYALTVEMMWLYRVKEIWWTSSG